MECKHIYAVQFSMKLKSSVEKDVKKEMPEEITFRPENCPECNGKEIVKRGKRKTQYGENQLFGCKSCGYRFTPDNGFSRMKHDPKAITLVLDLYFKGVSLRKICDHLKQFYEIAVNPTTPMRWIKKYLKILGEYADEYKADVGNIWHSDEMTIFIKKEDEEKYYEWLWNIMDADTRFLLACRVTKTRFVKDARKPLRDAKKRANNRPDVIVTDGLRAYQSAVPNVFYKNNSPIQNPHYRCEGFEDKVNNNILERLNGTFRERMKVMRSLSTHDGADAYVDGMRTYYNYIRPHQGIDGLTPAELAGIKLALPRNKWMGMIERASKQKRKACS